MAKQLEQELRDRVESFVADIAEMVKQSALDTVYEALGNGAAPARTATRRATTREAAPRASGIRRWLVELDAVAKAFLAHVKANPGARVEEAAVALGEPTSELKPPAKLLVKAGYLRTEGRKRGTRYFPVGVARKKSAKKAKRKTAKKSGKKTTTSKSAA